MKRSTIVYSLLTGGIVLGALSHNSVYRDRYASKADCLADWPRTPGYCEPEGDTPGQPASSSTSGGGYYGGGSGRWVGPSYEEGARPRSAAPHRALGSTQVSRGGFGSSGARFSASASS